MALIKCNECGKKYSDKASACPNCGCPIEKMVICKECKKEFNQDEECCPNCGYTNKPIKQNVSNNSQTFCLIGMIVAIVSCFLDFYGLVSATGLTFSIVGMVQTKDEKHKKFALVGIILAGIELFIKFIQLFTMYVQSII